MPRLPYQRYCAEIVAQTDALSALLPDADTSVAVPSCPDWDLDHLVRHLGGVQRWAASVVRARAEGPVSDEAFRVDREVAGQTTPVLAAWLSAGAADLADALGAADADTPVWTPVGGGTTEFYARRFTHESALHRADATLAVGADYTLDRDVAVDAIDEWMELGALPFHFQVHPWMRELLGPGRTVALRATDDAGTWLVDLTGEAIEWSHADADAAVTVHAPLVDLLLIVYKRRRPTGPDVRVEGAVPLLDYWLERVSFG